MAKGAVVGVVEFAPERFAGQGHLQRLPVRSLALRRATTKTLAVIGEVLAEEASDRFDADEAGRVGAPLGDLTEGQHRE